ncbi:MAG: hypothetical protein R6V03_08725 [Kiritimatiellia bacterium]
MKLPEDKNERKKVLMLIGLGTAAVIYGLYAGALKPLSAKKKQYESRIAEAEAFLKDASRDIEKMSEYHGTNRETLEELLSVADKYLLHPRLGGNYLLPATEELEKHRADLGIEFKNISEKGFTGVPKRPGSSRENMFRAYRVSVVLDCTYTDLLRFLRKIESDNPYVSVADLSVSGARKDNVELHSVKVDIQWPIWDDYRKPEELRRKLAEENAPGGEKQNEG